MRRKKEEQREKSKILDPSKGKDYTVEAIRSAWKMQYQKVVDLCESVLLYKKADDLYEKSILLEKAAMLSIELLT